MEHQSNTSSLKVRARPLKEKHISCHQSKQPVLPRLDYLSVRQDSVELVSGPCIAFGTFDEQELDMVLK
jgi:hypothetical protein